VTHINWAAELRKIEREFDGLPPEATTAEQKKGRDTQRKYQEDLRRHQDGEEDGGAGPLGVYVRLTLVISLCVGMFSWPYDVSCGFSLFGYLSAVATVLVGGIWTSLTTWQTRMPRSHVAALLIVLAGLVMAASQVLPRVGYANPSADRPTTWRCG
jgi:hypothetical protein